MRVLYVPSFVLGLLIALGLAIAASAEDRLALVIGNSSYENGVLPNPVNDARAVAESLRGVGFKVSTVLDADKPKMERGIRDFVVSLEDAGADAVAFVYYAGHGVQAGGENYLIPVGAHIERQVDLEIEAVSANWVLQRLEASHARLRFLVLDACRNNPLPRSIFRSSGQGLAEMQAAAGTFIGYSTSPGIVALDGKGHNSPYAEALARQIDASGITAESMFRRVRNDVVKTTNGEQVPWDASSLIGADFCFHGPCGGGGRDAAEMQRRGLAIGRILGGLEAMDYAVDFDPGTDNQVGAGMAAFSIAETGKNPGAKIGPDTPASEFEAFGASVVETARRWTQLKAALTGACPEIDFNLYFEYGSTRLPPEAGEIVKAAMQRAASCRSPLALVEIRGHEDTSSPPGEALINSARRARTAYEAMKAAGLLPNVPVRLVPRGKTDTAVPTGDGVREPLNRRVEVVLRF
jgi:outer membrane protein OmpA-like peptidoglycan-associated protein